jgi:TetR/AcrR family transcriptional repressor of nem operon
MEAGAHKGRRGDGRVRLLDAAMTVIRAKGYADTTVDELCQAAGVTKGAFFHHFRSKEDLAVAAAAHFGAMAETLFAGAGYRQLGTPLDRVLGYIDFRREILEGPLPEITCLLGTLVQEAYGTHPAIRDACAKEIVGHALSLAPDIAAAMRETGAGGDWTAESLALYIQGVLQGAFVLAKAVDSPQAAADMVGHLRRYVTQILQPNVHQEA